MFHSRYTLEELEDSQEDSAKKKRKSRKDVVEKLPLKHRVPSGHLFGRLDLRQVTQRLSSAGINDARVEQVNPGNFMIHLVSFKREIFVQI